MYGLRIQQKSVQTERKHADHAAELPFFQIEQQHDEHHEQGVEQHEQKDGEHTGVWRTHFKRLYKGGKCNCLSCARVAKNRRRLAPHIAHKALRHADEGGGDEDKDKVDGSRHDDIYCLSCDPSLAVYAHKVKGSAAGYERHIRKEQEQQQGG